MLVMFSLKFRVLSKVFSRVAHRARETCCLQTILMKSRVGTSSIITISFFRAIVGRCEELALKLQHMCILSIPLCNEMIMCCSLCIAFINPAILCCFSTVMGGVKWFNDFTRTIKITESCSPFRCTQTSAPLVPIHIGSQLNVNQYGIAPCMICHK